MKAQITNILTVDFQTRLGVREEHVLQNYLVIITNFQILRSFQRLWYFDIETYQKRLINPSQSVVFKVY